MKKETSAKGVKGFLITLYDENPRIVFRVYNKDKTFSDYEIHHDDLEVQITDNFASLLTDDKGNKSIDYNFLVLNCDPRSDNPTKKQLKDREKSLNKLQYISRGGKIVAVYKNKKKLVGEELKRAIEKIEQSPAKKRTKK